MSDQNLTGGDLYSRPTKIDDGAYLRIRQIRPVERAAAPIVDHNIQLTETALEVRPWYCGETRIEPSAYMSILLDPGRNSAVNLLAAFAATVKAFEPGSFPGHCHAVRELEFTTKHLINTLATLTDAAAFAYSLRCLGSFFAAISDPANTTLPKHDLVQRIDAKLEQLVDSFRAISRPARFTTSASIRASASTARTRSISTFRTFRRTTSKRSSAAFSKCIPSSWGRIRARCRC